MRRGPRTEFTEASITGSKEGAGGAGDVEGLGRFDPQGREEQDLACSPATPLDVIDVTEIGGTGGNFEDEAVARRRAHAEQEDVGTADGKRRDAHAERKDADDGSARVSMGLRDDYILKTECGEAKKDNQIYVEQNNGRSRDSGRGVGKETRCEDAPQHDQDPRQHNQDQPRDNQEKKMRLARYLGAHYGSALDGLDKFLADYGVPLVKSEYLRMLHREHLPLPRHQDIPDEYFVRSLRGNLQCRPIIWGAPPGDRPLQDTDAVFIDYACLPQAGDDDRTPCETEQFNRTLECIGGFDVAHAPPLPHNLHTPLAGAQGPARPSGLPNYKYSCPSSVVDHSDSRGNGDCGHHGIGERCDSTPHMAKAFPTMMTVTVATSLTAGRQDGRDSDNPTGEEQICVEDSSAAAHSGSGAPDRSSVTNAAAMAAGSNISSIRRRQQQRQSIGIGIGLGF
eukprot:gene17896-biopygen16570